MSEEMAVRLSAVDKLLQCLASGTPIGDDLMGLSGYDVHVMQCCMDMIAPHLDLIDGYKPLVVWLRDHADQLVVSEQDLGAYKRVKEVIRLYENTNRPDDKRYSFKTVSVCVRREGGFLVAVMELPEELRQAGGRAEQTIAQVTECVTATEIAAVLGPMRLQEDCFTNYRETIRVKLPLLNAAKSLLNILRRVHDSLYLQLEGVDASIGAMRRAFKPVNNQ